MLNDPSGESGDVLALVADRTPAAVIVLAPDGTIVSWNHGAERLLGHARSEVMGRNVDTVIVPAEELAARSHAQRQAVESGSACYAGERRRKDGTAVAVFVLLDVVPNGNGRAGYLVETLRDQRRLAHLGSANGEADTVALLRALTPRQREVLRWFGEGLSTHDIAQQLALSAKTIETHRAHLMKRLHVRNLAGLVRFAIRAGLVAPAVAFLIAVGR